MRPNTGLLLVIAAIAAPYGHVEAFHAADPDPPESEILYARKLADGLTIATARRFIAAELGEVPIWVPSGAANVTVALQTSNFLESLRPLAEVSSRVSTAEGGATHGVDLTKFGIADPAGSYRLTVTAFLADALAFDHVLSRDAPAFRAFASAPLGWTPAIEGRERALLMERIAGEDVTFATPASPHRPASAGDRVRLTFEEDAPSARTDGWALALAVGTGILLGVSIARGLDKFRAQHVANRE